MNVVNKVIIGLCISIICWCLHDENAYHLTSHYYACISPEFSDLDQRSITKGMSLWNDLGETQFYQADQGVCDIVVISVRGAEADRLAKRIHDPALLGYADFHHHSIYLFMDRIYDRTDLTNIAAHEFGHYLGLDHIPMSRFAIMNPHNRYFGFQQTHLFRADVEQYCAIWRCNDVNFDAVDDNVSYGFVDAGTEEEE